MIHAIVFDFGNVVGFFDHGLATSRLRPHARLSVEEMHRFIFNGALEDDYEKGTVTSAEFLSRLREHCGLTCTDDVIIRSYVDIFWPNAELCSLLPALKPRHRLLLGSNTTELHSRHFRREFRDVLANFDALILSHEIGARKPSAAFFDRCLELAGCSPDECLFVDDLPANVAGARERGWHAIVYTGVDSLLHEMAKLGITPVRR